LIELEELFRPLGIEGERAQRRLQFGDGPDGHPSLVVQFLDWPRAVVIGQPFRRVAAGVEPALLVHPEDLGAGMARQQRGRLFIQAEAEDAAARTASVLLEVTGALHLVGQSTGFQHFGAGLGQRAGFAVIPLVGDDAVKAGIGAGGQRGQTGGGEATGSQAAVRIIDALGHQLAKAAGRQAITGPVQVKLAELLRNQEYEQLRWGTQRQQAAGQMACQPGQGARGKPPTGNGHRVTV